MYTKQATIKIGKNIHIGRHTLVMQQLQISRICQDHSF